MTFVVMKLEVYCGDKVGCEEIMSESEIREQVSLGQQLHMACDSKAALGIVSHVQRSLRGSDVARLSHPFKWMSRGAMNGW